MKVLCIGDSLGMPRPGVIYEDTWFYRLLKDFPEFEFIDIFKRALLITEAINDYYDAYYSCYKADVVIIQTGVCDCAPRNFNSHSKFGAIFLKLVTLLRLSVPFWKIVRRRERKSTRVYTSLKIFEEYYEALILRFLKDGVKKIIVVKIGHCAPSVLKKSTYFNFNVDSYNAIIDRLCMKYKSNIIVIDPLCYVDESMFVDGYHCNEKGMLIVYNDIKDAFLSIVK